MHSDNFDGGSSALRPQDGNEWQERVEQWLRLRYGVNFQPVPASHGGDRAIEGYSTDGNVYQCYGARDGYDVRGLYERQRDKLTADIGKFISYRDKLVELLPSGFSARVYAFVVPKYESAELVTHANRKAIEVMDARLPYVASEFLVRPMCRKDFEAEQKQLETTFRAKLPLEFDQPTEDDLHDWTSQHDEGVKNLEWKLPLCTKAKTQTSIRKTRDRWISAHIRVANALQKLRNRAMPIWEELTKLTMERERRLDMRYGSEVGPMAEVKAAADELAEAMQKKVPTLADEDSHTLADGIVADWLQKCALLPRDEPSHETVP